MHAIVSTGQDGGTGVRISDAWPESGRARRAGRRRGGHFRSARRLLWRSGVLARVTSAGVLGIEAFAVEVEVEVALGLPGYHLVGMGSGSVKEGGVRVRASLANSGFKLPPRKITINLAPAEIPKHGA